MVSDSLIEVSQVVVEIDMSMRTVVTRVYDRTLDASSSTLFSHSQLD